MKIIIFYLIRFNGKSLPENYEKILRERTLAHESMQNLQSTVKGDGKSYGICDLFGTTNMARKTTIITFIWFCITSVYVGLSYYAPSLGELRVNWENLIRKVENLEENFYQGHFKIFPFAI